MGLGTRVMCLYDQKISLGELCIAILKMTLQGEIWFARASEEQICRARIGGAARAHCTA